MKRTGRKKEWTILVFSIFLLGIFPPVLFVFDKTILVFGAPLSFVYLYGFWGVMIIFMAIGAHRRQPDLYDGGSSLTERIQEKDAAKSVSLDV